MSSSLSLSADLQNANPRLLRRIQRACRPTLTQPDLGLNLEVCDFINEKQGSLPRQAAIVTVKLINSRDPRISELAIQLLDVLVKNCGYPFHLQISRKEFLNELVKRFPERPPARYSRTQRLILGQIEEWTQTICKTSRYKEDMGFIRDMRRLLAYKGYVFPELKREDAAVLNPSDNLKSIEELQREERIAQSAKLQELIRRGRPQDLKEANKLMKIMSGFKEDESLETTKQRVAEDINKLKRKVDLFNEMLNNASNLGKIDETDSTLVELYGALKVSQPKIQKIIEEESEDEEAVTNLLQLNDNINALLNKYQLLKGGDVSNANNIQVNAGSGKNGNSLNLINFDDDDDDEDGSQNNSGNASSGNNNNNNNNNDIQDLLSDLGGLSFSSNDNAGSIALETSPPPAGNGGINLDALKSINAASGSNGNYGAGSSRPPFPPPSSTTNNDFTSSLSVAPPIASQPHQQQQQQLDPFGFDFSSLSAPAPTVSQETGPKILINQSEHVKIEFIIINKSSNSISLKGVYSNVGQSPVSGLQFLVAVPKTWELQLLPQSGNFINAGVNNGITQFINITKKQDHLDDTKPLKIKWKCDYIANGISVDESGVSDLK
ncbi:hypothetical protein PACTADRAFT_48159 [Pachysolen tannophilus NRRL Y-2460]|uniref:VHS domain-containing protein n=1 Tax=Pachysolen tannophilus NRRL Y-2460 TaxID=669874 RepID=A0A1E4U2Z6_PACTA|nr:hypothetical protein PACTADRAFT_48159 [Pachysolen tannophilus NRRL Y-2460]